MPEFLIPAKSRETGREPGSRSLRYEAVFLDSGSLSASLRSSGMTFFRIAAQHQIPARIPANSMGQAPSSSGQAGIAADFGTSESL